MLATFKLLFNCNLLKHAAYPALLFFQKLFLSQKVKEKNCLKQVADPTFLKVSPLSPDFLQRQVCLTFVLSSFNITSGFFLFQNLTLFGSATRLPVEKLRNPAGAFILLSDFYQLTNIFWMQVLSLRWSPLRKPAVLGLDPGPPRLPGIQATSGRPASAQSAGKLRL